LGSGNYFTAFNINKLLENYFIKCVNNRYFMSVTMFVRTNVNYLVFLLAIIQLIPFFSDLITFMSFLFDNLGIVVFIILLFEYYNKNSKSLLYQLKRYKGCLFMFTQFIFLSSVFINNFNYDY